MRREAGMRAAGICRCMLVITSIAGAAAAAVTHGDLLVATSPDFDAKVQDVCGVKVRVAACKASRQTGTLLWNTRHAGMLSPAAFAAPRVLPVGVCCHSTSSSWLTLC